MYTYIHIYIYMYVCIYILLRLCAHPSRNSLCCICVCRERDRICIDVSVCRRLMYLCVGVQLHTAGTDVKRCLLSREFNARRLLVLCVKQTRRLAAEECRGRRADQETRYPLLLFLREEARRARRHHDSTSWCTDATPKEEFHRGSKPRSCNATSHVLE